ncbi:MAG TPA: pirin-like C-terminal cupin domain-containing protein [Hyalangium sp.]|nr:pirin-like C-terminal cupin domain-containing protein [Hyalangium sp.]
MDELTRRDALKALTVAGAAAATGCTDTARKPEAGGTSQSQQVAERVEPVTYVEPLGPPPWKTPDPFLFCVHHDDQYPSGNEHMGPNASLMGRNIGQDFEGKDGWRMYHGQEVPGFPEHPHRGFETVTVVRRGLLDHSDSLGAAARYGGGDVQWLTAGSGILHAEMFPLLNRGGPNPVELFQIWLNLPKVDKFAQPHFSMLWNPAIPRYVEQDSAGRSTEVTIVAGELAGKKAPAPPPKSWAAHSSTAVAIWTIKMAPGAQWALPAAPKGANRYLYFFKGPWLRIGGRDIPPNSRIELRPGAEALLENGPAETELLILQGQPINEPIVKYGPFVMNTREEIQQAIADFRATQFGGWPWPSGENVHPREQGRFARHADGHTERPG